MNPLVNWQAIDPEILELALAFGRRLVRQYKIQNRPEFESPDPAHKPGLFDLELTRQDSVEQAVSRYHRSE